MVLDSHSSVAVGCYHVLFGSITIREPSVGPYRLIVACCDVCLSIPSVVNEKGVIKTLNLALSPRETEQLHNSAKIMREGQIRGDKIDNFWVFVVEIAGVNVTDG